jgi:tetratricopeptide (TPR) repeat protein
MATGDFAGAVQRLHFASNLDPLDPYVYDQLGDAYSRAGQYRQAEEMYRRCIQIAPDFDIEHFFVANALLLQHRYDEALAELEREPDEGTRHAGRARVFHALGRHSESDSELQSFLSYLETAQIPWYSEVARIHAFRGERDRAMEFLEKAYQKRDVDLYFIKGDPFLKNLETDPRYKAFLSKMNLPE